MTDTMGSPLKGRCLGCNHLWVVLYAPMDLTVACKVIKNTHCPKCGVSSKKIVVDFTGADPDPVGGQGEGDSS